MSSQTVNRRSNELPSSVYENPLVKFIIDEYHNNRVSNCKIFVSGSCKNSVVRSYVEGVDFKVMQEGNKFSLFKLSNDKEHFCVSDLNLGDSFQGKVTLEYDINDKTT